MSFSDAALERREILLEKHAGALVYVQIELEPQAQENVGAVLVSGDARIAQRAKQNGVKIAPKHFGRIGREGCAVPQVTVRAPIEFGERDFPATGSRGGLQYLDGFRNHFLADAVAGDDGNAFCGTRALVHDRRGT